MAIRRRTLSAPRPPAEYTPQNAARDALKMAASRGLKLRPLDVVGLASSIGMQIEYLPLAAETSGFLRRKNGDWVIGVNSLHQRNRQRFTIAHELGHYFLHRDHGSFEDKALFRKELQNDHRESDANKFASALLMPEDAFREMAVRNPMNPQLIAAFFGVSEAAAKFRADALGEERIFG
jgi:Zn-dependent peptidase ImmA (M78 family)